jgi:predicted TIM-barrel fold metal-dependent hydrolase
MVGDADMSAGTHPVSILDCHVHFLDAHVNRHPLFQQRSPGSEALVADFSASEKQNLFHDTAAEVYRL